MNSLAGSDNMHGLIEVLGKLQGASATAEVKTEVTDTICDQMNSGIFGPSETKIAAEILSILANDIEINIRKIISQKLKSHPDLPHDLAMRLATDIMAVASPVLEFSFVLTDDDLIQIVRSTTEVARQQCVARRKPLSYRVVDELINLREKLVVKTVIENKEAYISNRSAEKILVDFKSSEDVLQALADRGNLPLTLVERMVTMVSEKVRGQLVSQYDISAEVVASLLDEAHNEIVLSNAQEKRAEEVDILVKHLHEQRKLNYTLVLRALCKGDLEFFSCGMAYLAGIPKSNVYKLIRDKSFTGFQALYKAADLPENLFEASKILLKLGLEEAEIESVETYQERIIRKIIASGYDKSVANMKYLITLINTSTPTVRGKSATVH